MLERWARSLPAYVVNGVTVSVGVGLVMAAATRWGSPELAQAANIGAVLASLPHLTGRALPTLRRTLSGGLLASLASFVVLLTQGDPWARGGVIGAVAAVILMGMSWGTKAAPIVFSVLLGMIFSMARPIAAPPLVFAAASASGVVLYTLWATLTAKLLEPHYRVLSVASALDAAAGLLGARAEVLTVGGPESPEDTNTTELGGDTAVRFGQLNQELKLAQALQVARDLVYPAAARGAGATEVALLARVSELREIVLTSRLDLELLGHDPAARFVRARLAVGLRRLSARVERLADSYRERRTKSLSSLDAIEPPDFGEAAEVLGDDERARLLPVVAARLRYLTEETEAIRRTLLGEQKTASLGASDLARLVVDDDTWPLAALRDHLTLDSPVLRHALRSSLAVTTAYALATALPWATKPYWMVLSVVVVLRGTLDDTLSRRNARVLGTAIGCVGVAVTAPIAPRVLLELAFVAAVGVAHAFVNVRYLLTAVAATVMALLQAQLAGPTPGSLVIERLLDTVLGASLAWAFSYVLPSWERRALPTAIERAVVALREYAEHTLRWQEARAEHRRVRQRAYDALDVVAASLRRSAAEPQRAQPPVTELVAFLDHAQRFTAHLSSVRSLVQRRRERLLPEDAERALDDARSRIRERLALGAGAAVAPPREPFPSSELPLAPAEREPLPWLVRRLDASVYDARIAGDAARRALRSLSA